MPLFRAPHEPDMAKGRQRRSNQRTLHNTNCRRTCKEDSVLSLTRVCLRSLADNMSAIWAKDYADNYLDHYSFRYIMGPFNLLPGFLVEELTHLLCSRKQLSRAALHLLLVPQLRGLSLESCPTLVNPSMWAHISARCQNLRSLNLSGALQLPSKLLCDSLPALPALRSLSLAGTLCDRNTVRAIVCSCRCLRHLDVSRCHLLPPAGLLPLGGRASCLPFAGLSDSTQPSRSPAPPTQPPLPLRTLLALDIGFGEQVEDSLFVAAYLLLSLPWLEKVALHDVAQACCLIEQRQFERAHEFAHRERAPPLEEVWRERIYNQDVENPRTMLDASVDEDGQIEEEWTCDCINEACMAEEAHAHICQDEAEKEADVSRQPGLSLQLKEVIGVHSDGMDSVSRLCPSIHSISVNIESGDGGDGQESAFASSIRRWSGQLQSLSVHYPGPLVRLLFSLKVGGSSLISLTLEGVKSSPQSPLLEIIRSCPKLRTLHISAEPPETYQEELVEDQEDGDYPRLPDLSSLSLNFSYEHSQMKPAMSWVSLVKVLRCLLAGSPSLEELSLIALPCPADTVFQDVLLRGDYSAASPALPRLPFERVRRVNLTRTDMQIVTVKKMMRRSRRLVFVDLSYCWRIGKPGWLDCKRTFSKVQVVWI